MKCCPYERPLIQISGALFTVTSSFWLRPALFFVIPFIFRGNHLLPDHLAVEHTGLPPLVGSDSLCLPSEPHISSFHALEHSYLVGRSMVVGHILMVHTCSLMCTNHIDMTAHIPAFLTKLGTTGK